jgi:hypothetical protein
MRIDEQLKNILTNEYDEKNINNELFYIYVIKYFDRYYVGKSKNIKSRIYTHKRADKNNINSINSKVYIIETLNTKTQMDIIEKVWILWFRTYVKNIYTLINIADNGLCGSDFEFLVNDGKIDKKVAINTNYNELVENNLIMGLNLIDETKIIKLRHEDTYPIKRGKRPTFTY